MIFVFIISNGLITVFNTFLERNGFDREFLIIANLFFFILSLAALILQRRGLQSENPNAFVRGVYGSILLKLFVVIIAVTTYAFIKTKSINKPAIFFSMGLYIIYTSIEVATLMKLAKARSNVKKRITS
ncbi:MAG: hypothetical protein ABIN97_16375 [Ginsengibacter sp.]